MIFNTIRKSQSGVFLILAIIFSAVIAIFGASLLMKSNVLLKETVNKERDHFAFFATEAGLDRVIYELRQNPDWGLNEAVSFVYDSVLNPNPIAQQVLYGEDNPIFVGSYTVQIKAGPQVGGWDTRDIKVTGLEPAFGDNVVGEIKRSIVGRVRVANPAKFAAFTLSDLYVASGATVDDPIFGRNIIVSEPLAGENINLNSSIFHLSATAPSIPDSVNTGGSFKLEQGGKVTFPGLDLKKYSDIANTYTEAIVWSDSKLNLSSDLQTVDPKTGKKVDVKLVYVDKDVKVEGKADHSVAIVSVGDITITGDVVASSSYSGLVKPQIGLFANEDIIIDGDPDTEGDDVLDVEALLLANGGVIKAVDDDNLADLSLNFLGSMAARGRIGESTIDMSPFGNRAYSYNPQLNENRDIPFTPFIADLISWSVANPNDAF